MNDLNRLDYLDVRGDWSVSAIVAIVLGLCCGPIMVALVWLTGVAYGISLIGGGIVAILGVANAIFCTIVFARTRRRPELRGAGLALAGLTATVLWSVGLIALFCNIDANLN